MPADPPKPWERQAGETEAAWDGFQRYRDLGPRDRSLAEVGRSTGTSKGTWDHVSKRYHWVERVQAWDAFTDQARRDADIAAIKEMRTRHIQMAMTFQGAAALALNKIVQAEKAPMLGADGKPMFDSSGKPVLAPLTLKPGEVRELAELGLKIERLNRGEPEAIQETRVASAGGAPIEELRIRFVRPGEKSKKP